MSDTSHSADPLARHLLRRTDQEKRLISKQLHDTTAQHLAALSMNLSILSSKAVDNPELQQLIADCTSLTAECVDQVRAVAYVLHPPLLDELGLEIALRAYAKAFSHHTAIHLRLEVQQGFPRLNADIENGLFRIVQERLNFLHLESDPTECSIVLSGDAEQTIVVIEDDAQPTSSPAGDGTLAFASMHERASQIGAAVSVDTRPHGTIIRAIIARR